MFIRWVVLICLVISIKCQAQSSASSFQLTRQDSAILSILSRANELARRDPRAALRLAKLAQAQATLSGRKKLLAASFETLAKIRFEQEDLLGSIAEADSAIVVYRSLSDSVAIGRTEQLIGDALIKSGNYIDASVQLEDALTIGTKIGDPNLSAWAYRSLGSLHYYQRQFERAWTYYRRSAALFRRAKNCSGLAKAYSSMAILAAEDANDERSASSLAFCDSSLSVARVCDDTIQLASVHINLALVLMQAKDLVRSKLHTDSGLMLARSIGDSLLIVHAFENKGQMAMRSFAYADGCANCTVMLRYAERHNMLRIKRDAMRCIMDAYRLSRNWPEAFKALERYNELRDSTYNSSSREEILTRSLVEAAQREQDADSIANSNAMQRVTGERTIERLRANRNRNGVLAVGGIAAVLLFALWVNRQRIRAKHQRDAAELRSKASEFELKALRAQMNPHFIFNALNSISGYVQAHKSDLAADFLTKFARLMRLVLENSHHAEVPLEKDLEALRLYMELECARLDGKFSYAIQLDPAIDQGNTLVPPLILQPFVENAIWHGISPKEGSGHINVHVRCEQARLVMTVEDDGVGRKEKPIARGLNSGTSKSSLGTAITRDRLAKHGEQHGGVAGFEYMPTEQGTLVRVELPLVVEPWAE
ncbi:MAG: histidine kinase [Flavobacteriales bacterium]